MLSSLILSMALSASPAELTNSQQLDIDEIGRQNSKSTRIDSQQLHSEEIGRQNSKSTRIGRQNSKSTRI